MKEIRNTNIEIRNKSEIQRQKIQNKRGFRHLNFLLEFVSDFDIRISDFIVSFILHPLQAASSSRAGLLTHMLTA